MVSKVKSKKKIICIAGLGDFKFDCVVITVAHDAFKKIVLDELKAMMCEGCLEKTQKKRVLLPYSLIC